MKKMVMGIDASLALSTIITAYAAIVGAKREGMVENVDAEGHIQERQGIKRCIT